MKTLFNYPGSKKRIISLLKERMPPHYNNYCELFMGSGALFFAIEPESALLNDKNSEIMNIYKMLRRNVTGVIESLKTYRRKRSADAFYKIRDLDLDTQKYSKLSQTEKAARTLYLCGTSFSNLYRTNLGGHFNAPFGKRQLKNNNADLIKVAEYLKNNDIKLLDTDYANTFLRIKKRDFVYLDPPYDRTFCNYITWNQNKEQARLQSFCTCLDRKKVYWMQSNLDTPLIRRLYQKYNIHEIVVRASWNALSGKKQERRELIITNY